MTGRPGKYGSSTFRTLLITIHRSFVTAWQSSMKIHEVMAENRIRFAQRLNEMSDELASLAKEVDKNRKQVCCIVLHEGISRTSPRPRSWRHATNVHCKNQS
jgi:hypothetical protein